MAKIGRMECTLKELDQDKEYTFQKGFILVHVEGKGATVWGTLPIMDLAMAIEMLCERMDNELKQMSRLEQITFFKTLETLGVKHNESDLN